MTAASAAELLDIANRAADAARFAILPYFRSLGLESENKAASGFDPVTLADRDAEQAIRAVLTKERPDDAILGEEFAQKAGTTGLTWVIDPIDGTRGFLAGTPTWGVLIAVSDAEKPIYGLIDQPYTGERWEGGLGKAAFSGPQGARSLRVRDTATLDQAILFSTFPEIGSFAERTVFDSLAGQVRLTRYGTDCYAYGLLALGHIDLVVEAGLNPYDICAPIAVVEAAGGIVTDWTGGPAHGGGRVLAAANRQVHMRALKILSGV
ncbi:histidinol-phosphatase [Actibacterium sp. 188UL27-1]|uniref:histidinol-phosphatase n=1 Tax=Actibacterium sp. 188UL27-1 TaxID=2786961 RepID=UPI00195E8751|nr:histidinol-phosphatase [Actibacterium sp. 188UL27-1]MBM7066678.1 histidinol-phosphatase [Actibacterium sp. 188UL27-1]